MEPLPEVPWYHPDNLTQYEGTIQGKEAKLSYASWESDGHKSSALNARYGDYQKHTVDNYEAVEVNNDEVICVVENSEKAYEIKTVSIEIADTYERRERKLRVIDATNLPSEFIRDNIISPRFPFLHDTSGPAAEKHPPRFYVVVSTHSGARQAESFYLKIVLPLLASGSAPERTHTKIVTVSSSSVTEFTQQTLLNHANAGTPQTVLLLSGDGGVVDILNALLSGPRKTSTYRSPTVGLVAMGTGNALAHSTGLSRDRTLGLRRFYRGNPRPLPTFTATFSPGSVFLVNEGRATEPLQTNAAGEGVVYGAVVCSWALHASIVANSDTTEYRRHGNERFSMAARELLRPADGTPPYEYRGRVSYSSIDSSSGLQNQREHGPLHSYVLATLVSHLEPGFHISPHSAPLDGQLRILRLGAPMAANAMEAVLGKAFTDGSHVDDAAVEYESVSSVRIEIQETEERWRRVCVDGKIVVVPEGGWVEVRKNEVKDSVLDIVA